MTRPNLLEPGSGVMDRLLPGNVFRVKSPASRHGPLTANVTPLDFALAEELVVKPKVVPMPELGVVVFESRHAPGFRSSLIKQDFSEFLLVIDGQAELTSPGGKGFTLNTNSLVHIPAKHGYEFRDYPNTPVTLYAIQYSCDLLPDTLRRKLAGLGVIHWSLDSSMHSLIQPFKSDCQEILFEQFALREGWETLVYSRFLSFAVRAARMVGQREESIYFERGQDCMERVSSYVARLKTHFIYHQTLDEAARCAGVSRRQFTALFRKVTGQSWYQFVLNLRLNYARQLLTHTSKTVIAIAFECGFDDLSHFNRSFKQCFGSCPSLFRARAAKTG